MRRKLCVSMIIAATVAALVIGIADIVGETDLVCSNTACLKVHSSSFATSFVIPLGFYAAAFLCLALILHLKGKEEASLLVLYALTGFEAYLTFIQVVFIHSLCTSCIVFFTLLVASCAAATRAARGHVQGGRNPALVGFFMFFVAHFAFFFPSVEPRPNLTQISEGSKKIEIFASPSCPHCEEALAELRSLASHSNFQLVVRPVSISRDDVASTVRWVCQKLFRCPSVTAQKLAEKIVWENQEEARKLSGGTLAVPIVVVSSGDHREIIRGWGPEALELVQLAAQAGPSRTWAAGENTAHFFQEGEENHVCSTGNSCN